MPVQHLSAIVQTEDGCNFTLHPFDLKRYTGNEIQTKVARIRALLVFEYGNAFTGKYIRLLISKENKLQLEVNSMQPWSDKKYKTSPGLSELQGFVRPLDRILGATKGRVPLTC